MKRVVKSTQVAHLWANQSQSEARNSNGSLYFNDKSIYSYGSHYELGRHITYNGIPVAMINTKGYSVTTRKQISYAHSACAHLIVVDSKVGLGPEYVREALVAQQDVIIDRLMGILCRRKFYSYVDDISPENTIYGLRLHNALVTQLGHDELKVEVTPDFWDLVAGYIKYRKERETELDKTAAARREALQLKAQENLKEELARWKRGELVHASLHAFDPQHIRVKDNNVETTRGASVPLNAAKQFILLLEKDSFRKGMDVGAFPFQSYDARTGIITIGCHRFDIKQVKEVLK